MYKRKSVGPKIGPWGTPALTGYFCNNILPRTTQSYPLLRKDKMRPNIWLGIPQELSLWKKALCQTMSKALNISSATAWVSPDLLKVLAVLSDTTVRRSAMYQEDLKPYWKSEKRSSFSRWSTSLLFTNLFTVVYLFTSHRRLTEWYLLAIHFFRTFSTGDTNETFQQSGKQDCFRHILKISDSLYEHSDLQFFRTITWIQSGPDAFEKSRLLMTFASNLEVTEILCSFRLDLDGKTGKEISHSSRHLETFFTT